MAELAVGVIVAIVAVGIVLEPLLRNGRGSLHSGIETDDDGEDVLADIEESGSPKVQALLALREIEFDRATGKLSDEDYSSLKERYSAAALEAIKSEEQAQAEVAAGSAEVDPAEAAVQRAKSRDTVECPSCGPRPERGATFCSDCGRSLLVKSDRPRCWMCGSPLSEGAKFCSGCGTTLS
jgi:hypothetical protein